ncbi:multiple sugar transport system substrate-binding protein [Paenibacillus sp. yr247]|uniref:ABC transporter substrate-binding protein n=1 Tax=Paenibacillus sp. yr247 TaxID=1761880 RepID=UPI000886209C|nr:extracellular solute-binding protein [Paenibacillus sp. yr247]SDO03676.1 multiple sugar transport system substrate-binding protein [Paenibacillus sp. yr247]
MKKNAIIKIGAFLLTATLSLGAVGCSSSKEAAVKEGPQTLKIAWWGGQDRHDRTLKVIKMFEEQNPNIKIETEYASFGDYWTKMATEAAGKNLPDVFQMDYGYLGEYTTRKLLEPLDSYVKTGKLDLKDVNDLFINGGKMNNNLYAVNLGANAPAMLIDPEVFQKTGVSPPKEGYTFDDITQIAKDLKKKVGKEDFYPIDTTFDFGYYLRDRGMSLYNKEGNGLGYDNDQYLTDFFSMESNLVKDGLMAPPQILNAIKSDPDTLIVKGNSAVRPFTSNLVVAFTNYAKHPLKLIPLPGIAGGQEGNYLKPALFFSVASDSKHKEAAVKFVDYFTNDLKANDVLFGERGVPISSKVREYLLPKLDGGAKEHFNYIDYVQKHSRQIDPPAPKGGSKVSDLLKRLQDEVLYGKTPPQDAAKQFRSEAVTILSANK